MAPCAIEARELQSFWSKICIWRPLFQKHARSLFQECRSRSRGKAGCQWFVAANSYCLHISLILPKTCETLINCPAVESFCYRRPISSTLLSASENRSSTQCFGESQHSLVGGYIPWDLKNFCKIFRYDGRVTGNGCRYSATSSS